MENPSNSDSGWSGIADKDGSTKIKLTNGDVIRYRSGDDKSWNYGIIDSKVPKSSSNTSRNCFTVQKDNVDESVNVDLESCDVEKLLPHEEESVTMLMGDNADVILITDNANVDSLEVEPNNLPLSSEYPSDAINLSGVVFRIIHAVETSSTF